MSGVASANAIQFLQQFFQALQGLEKLSEKAQPQELLTHALYTYMETMVRDKASAFEVLKTLKSFNEDLGYLADGFYFLLQLNAILHANETKHVIHITAKETELFTGLSDWSHYSDLGSFITFCEDANVISQLVKKTMTLLPANC